jgi:hypothetical protein
VIESWAWVSTKLIPHAKSLHFALATPIPTPSPLQTIAAAANPGSSWLWQFSTGPALGGVLALVAAILAFIRIGHQVEETKRSNNEIARKNSEERWWDTLKWTYTEAKESEAKGGKDATFRTVAAVGILDSLNQSPDDLTDQQRRAVESILNIFGSSKAPEVQDAIAPIYQSLRNESGVAAYEDEVMRMLATLNLSGVTVMRNAVTQGAEFDFLIQSAQRDLVIDVKAGKSPVGVTAVNQLLRAIARSPEPKKTAGILLSRGPITAIAEEILEGSLAPAKAIRWQPGVNTPEVQNTLIRLLNGQ